MVAVDEIGQPGRPARRRHQRIELVLVQHLVDALLARVAAVIVQRVLVFFFPQPGGGLRLHQVFLREKDHLLVGVLDVVGHQVGHVPDGRMRRIAGQVSLQPRLEFVQQHVGFTVVVLVGVRQLDIDQDRALRLHYRKLLLDDGVDSVVLAEEIARHSQAHALQAILDQRRGIVSGFADTIPGDRVAGIEAGDCLQHQGGVGDGARHRPGGVLRGGDRDDAAAAHQPQGWLDANQPAGRCRRHDRAVGLGADGQRGQAGGDRRARTGTRTAGVAVERIRIFCQSAATAPAADRVGRAHVGPFGEVGLADDDSAGRAQLRRDVRVATGAYSGQRQRTGAGAHLVAGGDVVLQ